MIDVEHGGGSWVWGLLFEGEGRLVVFGELRFGIRGVENMFGRSDLCKEAKEIT